MKIKTQFEFFPLAIPAIRFIISIWFFFFFCTSPKLFCDWCQPLQRRGWSPPPHKLPPGKYSPIMEDRGWKKVRRLVHRTRPLERFIEVEARRAFESRGRHYPNVTRLTHVTPHSESDPGKPKGTRSKRGLGASAGATRAFNDFSSGVRDNKANWTVCHRGQTTRNGSDNPLSLMECVRVGTAWSVCILSTWRNIPHIHYTYSSNEEK